MLTVKGLGGRAAFTASVEGRLGRDGGRERDCSSSPRLKKVLVPEGVSGRGGMMRQMEEEEREGEEEKGSGSLADSANSKGG
jgi:hypothetical protein